MSKFDDKSFGLWVFKGDRKWLGWWEFVDEDLRLKEGRKVVFWLMLIWMKIWSMSNVFDEIYMNYATWLP